MSKDKPSAIETQEKKQTKKTHNEKDQSMNMQKYNFQNCLNETEALYLFLNIQLLRTKQIHSNGILQRKQFIVKSTDTE